jgi:transposase
MARRGYPAEFRRRVVDLVEGGRRVFEHGSEYASEWAAIQSIAAKIGCPAETLRNWVRRAEIDVGRRDGVTSEERDRIKALEREVRELRRADQNRDATLPSYRIFKPSYSLRFSYKRQLGIPF